MTVRFNLRWASPLSVLLLLMVLGCRPTEPQPAADSSGVKTQEPVTLRVIVVDDAPLADRIDREWLARSGATLEMKRLSPDEFLSLATKPRLGADIVIYPTAMLGELASRERIISVADKALDDPAYDLRDIFKLVRGQETLWDKKTFGVSLGSPLLGVYYRRDLLESVGIAPPTTWAAYLDGVRKLTEYSRSQKAANENVEWVPVIEPLADGWAARTLLAHAAAYARHRSSYSTYFNFATMEPLIDQPSFVRALDELVAATKEGQELSLQATPADVRRLFYEGRCAMGISWPTAASEVAATSKLSASQIGFINLPGSPDMYNFRDSKWEVRGDGQSPLVPLLGVAGRVASITKESRYQEDALGMILWLTGPEMSATVSPASAHTMFFRQSQLAEAGRWLDAGFDKRAVDETVAAYEQAHAADSWLVTLNIPAGADYLKALDRNALRAVRQELPSAEALNEAAAQWKSITEQAGLEQQRLSYEQSLGIR